MITVTKLNDAELVVNADLIEFVERTPDTMISLITGRKVMVKESPHRIIELVTCYRAQTAGRQMMPPSLRTDPGGIDG